MQNCRMKVAKSRLLMRILKKILALKIYKIADFIKNKQVKEVHTIFNITTNFTVKEEVAVRNENAWAFEDINKDT
ncbi:hypothetical protein ACJIZ3_004402 [Penstemon smallii]|uniref:SKP1 component dimerisation domain-containing protein n=1 Tax=Penstemon smallii TaxID=265156 RepID=A0ABD3S240_9LAMI